MKKVLRYLAYSFLSVIGFLLLYLAVGWILSSITVAAEETDQQDVTIYLKSNGVHTDIVVPASHASVDWSEKLPHSHTVAADSTHAWVGIGWGDKGFYLETPTWAELKASVAFRAAFGLSTTAMHTTYYRDISTGENCKKLQISPAHYKKLTTYIIDSFQKTDDGSFVHIDTDAVYGDTDSFYEAKGTYSLFKTCNSWTNSALKSSGQKAALWTAFDTGILSKY